MMKRRIGIFTPPIGIEGCAIFSNFVKVLLPVSDIRAIITGNEGQSIVRIIEVPYFRSISYTPGKSFFARVLKYLVLQVTILKSLLAFDKDVDSWVFFHGAEIYLPVMAVMRLLKRKPIYCVLTSSSYQILSYDRHQVFLKFFSQIGYRLANNIIIYSPRLITEWNMEPYRQKILIAQHSFIDFNTFTVTTPFSKRPRVIGYISRLSAEKGVQCFIRALPAILEDQGDLRVLIGGDGPLRESIRISLEEEKIMGSVDLPGWISHDELPAFFNRLQLIVLPSFTEGLPNIMLEAMACGTPMLATPVGAIPDVITDGQTGFIMEDNSPECISKNVIRALRSPDLEKISSTGRRFVMEHFTFEQNVMGWKKIFD
jgi:glycosyltransferase involved in cell wall biosynthesis